MWSDCLINQIIRDTQTAMWLMLNENEIIFVLANKNQSLDMFV